MNLISKAKIPNVTCIVTVQFLRKLALTSNFAGWY